jgi:hypothetical protein
MKREKTGRFFEMTHRKHSVAILAAAAAFMLLGCPSETVKLDTSIIIPCNQTPDVVFKNAETMRLTVTGKNIPDPMMHSMDYGSGNMKLPNIPLSKDVRLTAEAFNAADPATSALVARGQSTLIDLSSPSGSSMPVGIFMSAVDMFAKTTDLASKDKELKCTALPANLQGHVATMLPDGRVLITGGYTVKSASKLYSNKMNVYDPATGAFTVVANANGDSITMYDSRAFHTTSLINLGTGESPSWKVLIAGGLSFLGDNEQTLARAEIFDIKTWNRDDMIILKEGRANHTATVLSGAVVVLIGGMKQEYNSSSKKTTTTYLSNAEYYDPGLAQMTAVPTTMLAARAEHTAEHIVSKTDAEGNATEQIFLFGGRNETGLTPLVEYYDHSKKKFGQIKAKKDNVEYNVALKVPRYGHASSRVLISQTEPNDNGEVLYKYRIAIAGGFQCVTSCSATTGAQCCGSTEQGAFPTLDQSLTATIEIFDPSETLNFVDPDKDMKMQISRASFTMTAVQDLKILVAGGRTLSDLDPATKAETKKPPLKDSEIISLSALGAFKDSKATGSMTDGRYMHAAVPLDTGMVLITGGYDDKNSLGSAELYNPRVEVLPNPE